MGSSSKKSKETTTYTPPTWVEDTSKRAINLATKLSERPYVPYTAERVAPLSANERQGIALASSSVGGWKPYLDEATNALGRATKFRPFTSADMNSYMNPYIKGALDPAAREIRNQGALTLNDLRANQSQRDAFGGARGALLESEAQKNIDQGISDLYGRGYAAAFESGADRWERDRAFESESNFRAAAGYAQQAAFWRDSNSADINELMATGATDRNLRQAMADFDYYQFTEAKDWDVKNLAVLLSAIQGVHGSYTTTRVTKRKEKTSDNPVSTVIGIAALIAGAYTGNPALMSAGASAVGS